MTCKCTCSLSDSDADVAEETEESSSHDEEDEEPHKKVRWKDDKDIMQQVQNKPKRDVITFSHTSTEPVSVSVIV